LTALSGNLTLLEEIFTRKDGNLQILQEAKDSSRKIEAVLRVLQQVTKVEHTIYHEQVQMIDIEAVLREELNRL
jgi:hypothetical protein